MSYVQIMGEKELHTLRMLARRFKPLGLSMAWLKAEAMAGRIPCCRVGRRFLFDPAAVELELVQRAGERIGPSEVPRPEGDARRVTDAGAREE